MAFSFAEAFTGEEHLSFLHEGTLNTAVLLIHGFPGTPAEMKEIAKLFHAAGYTVSAPLLPGFGANIDSLPNHTYQNWLNATEYELKRLRQSHDDIIICGNSMGGAIAICHAAKYRPSRLLLFAPFWQLNNILWKALPIINLFINRVKPFRLIEPDFDDPAFREGITNFMPNIDLNNPDVQQTIRDFEVPITMFKQIHALGKKAYDVAPKVDCPTLILQGTEDELVVPEMTQKLKARINHQTEYVEIAASHDLLDTNADTWHIVSQTVSRFLQQDATL